MEILSVTTIMRARGLATECTQVMDELYGGSSLGGLDNGGAGEITMPSEDPWFCVRPAPGKCADFDDGSYVVTIQAHLPMPTLPPPP